MHGIWSADLRLVRHARIVGALSCLFIGAAAQAQGDGPRAYQVVPDGTTLLSVYGMFLEGNQTADPGVVVKGADIDVSLGIVQLTHSFDFLGKQAAAFAVLPYGEVSGKVRSPSLNLRGSNSGMGDLIVGGIVGLIGPPPLSVPEFVAYDPGFALGVLAKVSAPTGQYDAGDLLNVGGNRWTMTLGVPLGWYLGQSFLDPRLATVELLPSLQIFGDNSDPLGANETGQNPMFRLEAHLTKNLHRAVWVSVDGMYLHGGETSKDGRDNDDAQDAFELGGTVNVSFSKTSSVKLSYGEVVSRNDDGPDGRMARLIFNLAF
jgi:hypothetical protein